MNQYDPNCYLLVGSTSLKIEDVHSSLIYSSLLDGYIIPLTCPIIVEILLQYSPLYTIKLAWEPIIDEYEKQNKFNSNDHFQPFTALELLAMPPKKWLIKEIVGSEDIGMIYGPSGTGKTFVVIDLIIKACLGKKFAFTFDIVRPLNVCYCAGEGYGGLPSRFKAAFIHHKISDLPNFTFYKVVPQLFNVESETHAIHFINSFKKRQENGLAQPLDILIIDTLQSATLEGDENKTPDMNIIFRNCQRISKSLSCSVIVVHHTNKGEEVERGSGAFRCSADFMIQVHKATGEGNFSTLSCSKIKDGKYFDSLNYNLGKVENSESVRVVWAEGESDNSAYISKEQYKDKILELFREHPDRGFTCKQVSNTILIDEKKTNKLLNELFNKGLCIKYIPENTKQSTANPWLFSHKKTIMD